VDGAAEVYHPSWTGRAGLHQVAAAGKRMPESSPIGAMVARLCSGHVGGLFVLLFAQNRTTKRISQSLSSFLLGRLAVINLVVFFGVGEEFAIIVAV
jgi:hypothetical protein